MPVTCPHCSTRYVLPRALLGPGGARVRCPRCREPFAVGPDGEEIVPLPAAGGANGNGAHLEPAPETAGDATEAASAAAEAPTAQDDAARRGPPSLPDALRGDDRPRDAAGPSAEAVSIPREADHGSPAAVARAVLDDLCAHSGEAIAASQAEGRLFREFGDVIAEAYEFYRRRLGSNADPAPFRAALRERWGVELEPGRPPRRLI